MTAWTEAYLHLRYDPESLTPPTLNCRGLYLMIVRDRAGVALPDYGVSADALKWVRGIERERASGDWLEVEPGQERELDLVLMREIVGRGDYARPLALHCGCVVEPGRMIDISRAAGVRVTQFRDTPKKRANGTVRQSVIGIYRPQELAK